MNKISFLWMNRDVCFICDFYKRVNSLCQLGWLTVHSLFMTKLLCCFCPFYTHSFCQCDIFGGPLMSAASTWMNLLFRSKAVSFSRHFPSSPCCFLLFWYLLSTQCVTWRSKLENGLVQSPGLSLLFPSEAFANVGMKCLSLFFHFSLAQHWFLT